MIVIIGIIIKPTAVIVSPWNCTVNNKPSCSDCVTITCTVHCKAYCRIDCYHKPVLYLIKPTAALSVTKKCPCEPPSGALLEQDEHIMINTGPFMMNTGPYMMNTSLFMMNTCPFMMNTGPFMMNTGPFRESGLQFCFTVQRVICP